ncbi:hypothetical protein F5Y18DRAFT_162812 [Xylariaceae sp. FL1019]|nr:hypothetical protein F5Y18DRAFT_162812 [Xylariaceae sp. FL1019]
MASFSCFPRLPPELRYEIWLVILDHWTVIAVDAEERSDRLQAIGWDKCVVGRVCREARTIMEKTSQAFDDGVTTWIQFQSTTLYLGGATRACDIIGLLDARLCTNVAHVAIVWTTWSKVVSCVRAMSKRCHSLVSVLILDAGQPVFIHEVPPLTTKHVGWMAASRPLQRLDYEPWWMDGNAVIEDLRCSFSGRTYSVPPALSIMPL